MKNILALVIMLSTMAVQAQVARYSPSLQHLLDQKESYGLKVSDIENAIISDQYTSDEGITYTYYQQAVEGVPIHNAITAVITDSKGKNHNVSHRFVPDVLALKRQSQDRIKAVTAIQHAANHLGLKSDETPVLLRSDDGGYLFRKPSYANNDIKVRKIYVKKGNELRLGWDLAIDINDSPDYMNTIVDAADGGLLWKHNYTTSCSKHHVHHSSRCNHDHASHSMTSRGSSRTGAKYNVFAFPTESPIHGNRTILVDPHDTEASPYGWHDVDGKEGAEYTITKGNNVHSYLDPKGFNESAGDEPDGGKNLNFDFSFDGSLDATSNKKTAQVNLFYAVNRLHDLTYKWGFDEKAGNFQSNNYGKGGRGGDHVLAEAFDGYQKEKPTLNNANFSTPPDGNNGRMQMFLWDNNVSALNITEPKELLGPVAYGAAEFGGGIPTASEKPIVGKVVQAIDTGTEKPLTACNAVKNKNDIKGNIALIERGECSFVKKVKNAENAGAIAVIVCNIEGADGTGEELIRMGGVATDPVAKSIKIPSVFIKRSACKRIQASLKSAVDVTVRLQEQAKGSKKYLDASLDNGIIAHEFGHGVSNRLVGGPSNVGCLTSTEQMGEGISDILTIFTTVEKGDKPTDYIGIGNYAAGQKVNGTGIRRYPFTTDMEANPLTYATLNSIDNSNPDNGYIYRVGEVYTTMIWEMFWKLVEKYGLDPSWNDQESGNFKAARLLIEGMKMSPCNPSFLDSRNAILKADTVLYNGANGDILWEAFAKRGLGYLASDKGSGEINDSEENFDVFPLSVKKLKISKKMPNVVRAGQEIKVSLGVINHVPKRVSNVIVEDRIPAGFTYVSGSSSKTPKIDNDLLRFEIGDMDFQAEDEITYSLKAVEDVESKSFYFQDLETEPDNWDIQSFKGTLNWEYGDDHAYSGENSFGIEESDSEEHDQTLVTEAFNIVGERPTLKFWHRWDTQKTIDGGFIQVSTDGKKTWQNITKNQFLRNPYNSPITYSTFAIPRVDGFSGTSGNRFVDSYIDLTAFKNREVHFRFRFGTDATVISNAEFPGWYIDNIELMDLRASASIACVSGDEGKEVNCSQSTDILFESINGPTSTEDIDYVESFTLSPNPASEYVAISVKTKNDGVGKLSLLDITGRHLGEIGIPNMGSHFVRSFDTSSLSPGVYFIRFSSNDKVATRKLVVQ